MTETYTLAQRWSRKLSELHNIENKKDYNQVLKSEFEERLAAILPLDKEAMAHAAAHLDSLTKPPGSLGKLERIAEQLSGVSGKTVPNLAKKVIVVMAGDHGVCEEGVSAFPQEVTGQMVMNFLQGGAAVNVLAKQAGAEVVCVDIGVKGELSHPGLVSAKVRKGTANMRREPAMTKTEVLQAILTGMRLVDELVAEGYGVIGTGEMGIGNTTPSAAMLSVLAGVSLEEAVGKGTGIDDQQLAYKREVIRAAIEQHGFVVGGTRGGTQDLADDAGGSKQTNVDDLDSAAACPDSVDALEVLRRLGGLEIAGLTGVILGAASRSIPVVIDGFISTAAALTAARLQPLARGYMFPSHLSLETGHIRMLDALALEPILQMDMRLGEGTGAALAFPIIESAVRIMAEMATFESAGISGKSE